MSRVLNWRQAPDLTPLIQGALEALAQGQILAVPTECTYSILGRVRDLHRLRQVMESAEEQTLALAVPASDSFQSWISDAGTARLLRRFWPGPITAICKVNLSEPALTELPSELLRLASDGSRPALRMPEHSAVQELLRLCPEPLLIAEVAAGTHLPVTAQDVLDQFGERVDLLIDDGACHFGQRTTILNLGEAAWEVLREGVVGREELEQLAAQVIVFVCTGNTCRSPMAEALCKRMLADTLGCSTEELPARGFLVLSAGVAAYQGGSAAAEAIAIAEEVGADLSGHVSRPLTPGLAAQADLLVGMTRSHVTAIQHYFGAGPERTRLLSPAGEEIDDPIGGGLEDYRACARQIQLHLNSLIRELHGS